MALAPFAARMEPKSLGLMMLLWVQTAANGSVTGIIGSTVELKCSYEPNGTFMLNNFRVTWQKEGEKNCFIETYDPDQEDLTSYRMQHQCADFRERTQFSKELKQGKFTLRLLRISPKDEFTYICFIVKKNEKGKFEVHHEVRTNLKVAANYSNPVLTQVKSGDELMFNCTSSHGYPQPKIYWINHTDNSLLNATQKYIRAPDGTFRVISTLVVKAGTGIKLECTVENEQLQQNLTATFGVSDPPSRHLNDNSQNKTQGVVLGSAAAVIITVLLILYIWWKKRKASVLMTYTAPAEMENRDFGLLK